MATIMTQVELDVLLQTDTAINISDAILETLEYPDNVISAVTQVEGDIVSIPNLSPTNLTKHDGNIVSVPPIREVRLTDITIDLLMPADSPPYVLRTNTQVMFIGL